MQPKYEFSLFPICCKKQNTKICYICKVTYTQSPARHLNQKFFWTNEREGFILWVSDYWVILGCCILLENWEFALKIQISDKVRVDFPSYGRNLKRENWMHFFVALHAVSPKKNCQCGSETVKCAATHATHGAMSPATVTQAECFSLKKGRRHWAIFSLCFSIVNVVM